MLPSNPKRPMELPPQSMPWGRWVEGELESTSSSLSVARSDVAAAHSIFNARADNIANQFYGITGLANITTVEVPDFTATFTGGTGSGYVLSPPTFISVTHAPSMGFTFCRVHAEYVSGGGASKLAAPGTGLFMQQSGSLSWVATNDQPGVSADPNNFYGWVCLSAGNKRLGGGIYTNTFAFGSGDVGTIANPLVVKFTGCYFGAVEVGSP